MSTAPSRHLYAQPLRTDPVNCTSPAATIGADLDRAIAQFRNVMPGCGLKVVVPPLLSDGNARPVSLSAWRRGEQSARVYSGMNAREILQQLFDSELQAEHQRRPRTQCLICRGIGWYIAESGVRAICSHSASTSPG